MQAVAALALLATLYHCLNHAFMKSLLFLGTGAVLHATGERNLGRLGGLIHRMPWVAWLSLIGVLAIAGLPPLNGFVSEWLLLQSFLFADRVPHEFVNLLIPMGTALVALCAALAGYVMVKFFGVIFLGQPRELSLARAHDCGRLERFGLVWLALGCVLLGLLPLQVVSALAEPSRASSVGAAVPQSASQWWLLAPVPGRPVSYGPLVFLLATAAVVALTVLGVRLAYHQRVRRAGVWDCGFGRSMPGCRIRQRASVSRSATSSSRSLRSSGSCRRPPIARPATESPSGTGSGARCTSRLDARCNDSPTPSLSCSRGGSRRICSTAS